MHIAAMLSPEKVVDVTSIASGGNSRIYRVESSGKFFALKFYRNESKGLESRLDKERKALLFINNLKANLAPKFFNADKENNCSLIEWIDGQQITKINLSLLKKASDFIGLLHENRLDPLAKGIALGTEACISGLSLEKQFLTRTKLLSEKGGNIIKDFIDAEFIPLSQNILSWVEKDLASVGISMDDEVNKKDLTLSPVDFGFHNSMLIKKSHLIFLDFEYFGWADPVHLVSDTLAHPGMKLSNAHKKYFFKEISNHYDSVNLFKQRMKLFYPLYQLRWCLIMLNVFLPDFINKSPQQSIGDSLNNMQKVRFKNVKKIMVELRKDHKNMLNFDK